MPTSSDRHNFDEMFPSSLASLLGSIFVMISFFKFERIRRLSHIKLVFIVSCNYFVASLGGLLGPTTNNTPACYFQTFATSYNFLSAVFWTTAICYQLRKIVKGGTEVKDLRYFFVVCQIFPFVTTILPLTTQTYGNMDDENKGWCFFSNRPNSPAWGLLFWRILGFYLWLWISIALTIFFLLSIFRHMSHMNISQTVFRSVKRMALYPITFTICWIPATIFDLLETFYVPCVDRTGCRLLQSLTNVLPLLGGAIVSIIFVLSNANVRNEWKSLFFGETEALRELKNGILRSTRTTTVRHAAESNCETERFDEDDGEADHGEGIDWLSTKNLRQMEEEEEAEDNRKRQEELAGV